MAKTVPCPECRGSGCDPDPLQAPADGALYLFPRCAFCRGKGTVTPQQQRRHQQHKGKADDRPAAQ